MTCYTLESPLDYKHRASVCGDEDAGRRVSGRVVPNLFLHPKP